MFPVTLTMDDPGVADEASFPTSSWQRDAGPSNQYNLQWEYDKTITPTTALIIYNQGYNWLQSPMQLTFAPGLIYLGDTFQVGVEALIPGNRATGHNVGVIAQLHFFFDDIFPNSIGRPLLQ